MKTSLLCALLFGLLISTSDAQSVKSRHWSTQAEDFVYARLLATVQRHEQPSCIVIGTDPVRLDNEDLAKASKYRTILPSTIESFRIANIEAGPLSLTSERQCTWKEATKNFDPDGWDSFVVRISHIAMELPKSNELFLCLSRVGQSEGQALVKYRYVKGARHCSGLRLYRYDPKYDSWVFIPAN